MQLGSNGGESMLRVFSMSTVTRRLPLPLCELVEATLPDLELQTTSNCSGLAGTSARLTQQPSG